jgi:hypothetical protein
MTQFADLDLIFGHTSEETALVVDDYPYGRRVRTQIRYWIESVAKRGDRFVSQTLNPKTGAWNKPKKSTYAPVGVMFREAETGYVRWTGLREWADEEELGDFCGTIGVEQLNEIQRVSLARVIGRNRAFKDVTFSIKSDYSSLTEEERAEFNAEQKRTHELISKSCAIESVKAHRALTEVST